MGTRSGSLDPGVLLYLMDELEMDARALEKLIYQRSGLLGVSGLSSDMRVLLKSDLPDAGLGVELDETANASGGPRISRHDSAASVWVIATGEELMIARHTRSVVSTG